MKNISSIQKSDKTESPKTPGGISKSFLTPCRRVGLSRNWRKSGPSPFISPLSSNENSNEDNEKQEPKKRKCTDEESVEIPQYNDGIDKQDNTSCSTPNSTKTPRNLLPRKKSKTLLLANDCDEDDDVPEAVNVDSKTSENRVPSTDTPKQVKVAKLSRTKSKVKCKVKSPLKELPIINDLSLSPIVTTGSNDNNVKVNINSGKKESFEKKSPENLTKECIVVIQKKLFKTEKETVDKTKLNTISQTLFDSDSDDVPLCNLNKKADEKINDDDEFQEKRPINKPIKTPSVELKTNKVKEKNKTKSKTQVVKTESQESKSSVDIDDDDDFVSNKKTIIVKKSYDKVTKPSKAKSTGSISQKDIDELMARIEAKKNLLLAKAMTNETFELRNLIKKWQKGCQNALSELLELMKSEMPDQNMNYAEILQILKIPPDLVGYDSENDCFVTPEDNNIVLSSLNL